MLVGICLGAIVGSVWLADLPRLVLRELGFSAHDLTVTVLPSSCAGNELDAAHPDRAAGAQDHRALHALTVDEPPAERYGIGPADLVGADLGDVRQGRHAIGVENAQGGP